MFLDAVWIEIISLCVLIIRINQRLVCDWEEGRADQLSGVFQGLAPNYHIIQIW